MVEGTLPPGSSFMCSDRGSEETVSFNKSLACFQSEHVPLSRHSMMMSPQVRDLRQRAAAVCVAYIEESLLTCADEYVATWVPLTYRIKMASYVLQWYRALPLKGIILGQSPSAQDTPKPSFTDIGSIPLSAAFSYNEDALACKRHGLVLPPLATDLLAQQIGRCCAIDEETVLASLRDCHQLLDQGVIVWYALPLGKQEVRYNNQTDDSFRVRHNSRQLQTLAHALMDLLSISNQMEPSPLETTTVVGLGVWARWVTSVIRAMTLDQSIGLTRRVDIKDEVAQTPECPSTGQARAREGFLPLAPPAELRAVYTLLNFPRHSSPRSLSSIEAAPALGHIPECQIREIESAVAQLDDQALCSTVNSARLGKPRLRLDVSRLDGDDDPPPKARYSAQEKGKAIMIDDSDSYAPSPCGSDDD